MQSVPEKETMDAIAELFKGFADSTRVHILALLSRQELCVTDIAETVDVSQSAISHQLRILKQMHLIKCRREGKNSLCSLADDHVKTILQMGLEHVLERRRLRQHFHVLPRFFIPRNIPFSPRTPGRAIPFPFPQGSRWPHR